MIAFPLLVLCTSACSPPLEPSPHLPGDIQAAPAVTTDSACRTVTVTLVGSNNLSVAFPNRAQCGSGLVLIPGGTPTRSGPGKRNVNLPVRLLNTSSYTIQSPATTVLPPGGRLVLAPAGQPATAIIPQNADSVRAGTGEWVWLVGSSGTVAVGDSTAARTLVIRLDSPVTSGQVTFTMEAPQLTPAGWLLLTSNSPGIDTTKQVQRPGTDMIMYRTSLMLRFQDGLSDQQKQAILTANGLTVLGVTVSGLFYVSFADPGPSITAFDAFVDSLNATPGIWHVLPVYRSGGILPHDAARFPNDSLRRASWLFRGGLADSLWAMKAVRAPYAWGCETGTYGGTLPATALVEWSHDPGHTELGGSSPSFWAPADHQLGNIPNPATLAARDSGHWHAAETAGLLSAGGDNGSGIAGVAWRTRLQLFALRSSPQRRSLLTGNWNLFATALRQQAQSPRVLSLSVDGLLPSSMSPAERARWIAWMTREWRVILDSLPGLLIVVAAGNEALTTPVAAYHATATPALLRSGLLALRLDPAYTGRIVVVAGTSPGNQRWAPSNVFTDATDIAAPAENLLVMDTTRAGQPVGIHLNSGTSLATPMVAATAALLLTMDPDLAPAQVKDYILRGAQVPRNDSLTAGTVTPTPVQGQSFYQLDAYGALHLLSKERPGTPICGYPVVAGGLYVYLQKNGPLMPATDSIKVPGAANAVGRLSVAQGGRRLAVYTGSDSLAGFDQSMIEFDHLGQRRTHKTGYRTRLFLERGLADIVQLNAGGSLWQAVTLSEGPSGYLAQLTFPDGSPANAWMYDIDVSPDARFVSFQAGRSVGGQSYPGVYVKRFSDQVSTAITECAYPCPIAHHPVFSHDGRRFLIASAVQNPDSTYTGFLQPFAVDTTPSGGFVGGSVTSLPGRYLTYGYSYTGDDAAVYGCEVAPAPPATWWVVRRAAAALSASNQMAVGSCPGEDRRIANVVAAGR